MPRFLAATPLVAAGVTFALCPLLAKLAPRLGLMDEPDEGRKRHGRPIPLVGGIAVWLGVGVLPLWSGVCGGDWGLLVIYLLTGLFAGVGFLDDWYGLAPARKLVLQFLAGSALAGTWLVCILLFEPTWGARDVLFALCLTVGSVLLCNAYNFTDNSNGQCGGLAAISLGAGAVAFWGWGDAQSSLLFAGFAAAFLGFLTWNYPNARVFLGDCGSHLAGALVAVWVGLLLRDDTGGFNRRLLAVGLILFVPLLDFTVAVGGRLLRGQAPWKGDMTHLYHRLVARGLKPAAAVAVLWLAALVTSAAGVSLLTR